MSSSMAIAAVTHSLKRLIDHKLNTSVISTLGITVTSYSPDVAESKSKNKDNYINLYLYRVQENQGWQNHDFPARNNSGYRISNPYLSLDLHYVLSAHGKDELHGDMMLGYSMLELHDNPILGRDFIATEIGSENIIKASGLSNQIEQIKITPESLNTEEISKLWTMFGAKHRQSAYYKATVVLMRKERAVSEALPVKERKVYAKPFKQPIINELSSKERANPNYKSTKILLAADDLIISGSGLKGETTMVTFDGKAALNAEILSDDKLKIKLPNNLDSGIHSVQVIHKMMLGEPPLPHDGVNSNLAAFVLSPVLNNINFNAGKLEANIEPALPKDTKYSILLNEIGFDTTLRSANEYAINGRTASVSANLSVDLDTVSSGTYLVRIRVNNASSPLFDNYTGPKIVKP